MTQSREYETMKSTLPPLWTYWIPVVAAVVAMVATIIVALLSQRLERLKADLECINANHKAAIENAADQYRDELQQATERHKAKLAQAINEHQIRFAKLHEKRAEVITSIYKHIRYLEDGIIHMATNYNSPQEFPPDGIFQPISAKMELLLPYFRDNRLFIDEPLCTRIDTFIDYIKEGEELVFICQQEDEDGCEPIFHRFRERFPMLMTNIQKQLTAIRYDIEGEFRLMLGVSNEHKINT